MTKYSTPRQCNKCGELIQLQFKGSVTFIVNAVVKGEPHKRHRCKGSIL